MVVLVCTGPPSRIGSTASGTQAAAATSRTIGTASFNALRR
ncbi:MAG: hypothetical protein RMA76_33075 [Deltaproteobacteria bacterium]